MESNERRYNKEALANLAFDELLETKLQNSLASKDFAKTYTDSLAMIQQVYASAYKKGISSLDILILNNIWMEYAKSSKFFKTIRDYHDQFNHAKSGKEIEFYENFFKKQENCAIYLINNTVYYLCFAGLKIR